MGPVSTSETICFIELNLNGLFPLSHSRWLPIAILVTSGAGNRLIIPINLELGKVKSVFVLGLPTLVPTNKTDQIDLVIILTANQIVTREISPIELSDHGVTSPSLLIVRECRPPRSHPGLSPGLFPHG